VTRSEERQPLRRSAAGAVAPPIAGRPRLQPAWNRARNAVRRGRVSDIGPCAKRGTAVDFWVCGAAAILLDFCVSANLVFGQRAIFSLEPKLRSRINGLFMATFFAGGAIGAALSGWFFTHYGWKGVTIIGCALPIAGLICLATDRAAA
jgi:MFS family permease